MKRVSSCIVPGLFLAIALLPVTACDAQIGARAEDADNSSLWFDGEEYQLAWAAPAPAIGQEYVRAGETVESWTQMLTFAQIEGTFDEVIGQYLERRRPAMASEPDILVASDSSYAEDIIIRLVLVAPDGSSAEFVLGRAVANPGEPVRTLVFSKKLASAHEADLSSSLDKTDGWIAELASFPL